MTGIFFDIFNDFPWGGQGFHIPRIGHLPGTLVAVSSSKSLIYSAEDGIPHGSGV